MQSLSFPSFHLPPARLFGWGGSLVWDTQASPSPNPAKVLQKSFLPSLQCLWTCLLSQVDLGIGVCFFRFYHWGVVKGFAAWPCHLLLPTMEFCPLTFQHIHSASRLHWCAQRTSFPPSMSHFQLIYFISLKKKKIQSSLLWVWILSHCILSFENKKKDKRWVGSFRPAKEWTSSSLFYP